MVRAEKEQVDVRSVLRKAFRDVLMHSRDIVDSIQAARDPGLVRHDSNRDTGPIELGYRLRRPVDELDAVDGADVAVVNDDRAIAIEKDSWLPT
jgi:hypothetical protein